MRDKSTQYQPDELGILIASDKWSNLKNRFSGRLLFKFNYFNLVNGNLSILDRFCSKGFNERLFEYAGSNYDINLIPALKIIANGSRYDENVKNQASGLVEVLENYKEIDEFRKIVSPGAGDEEKIFNSRILLAGTRLPQTTEILRMLREKSPEMKRIALCLIGKFKMTGFLNEVCECLGIPGLENEAFSVLHSFGSEASNDLQKFYIASSGNSNTSRLILMLLGEIPSEENLGFIYSRLWSNSRKIKELALQILTSKGFKAPETEKEKLDGYVYEITGFLTWLLSLKVYLNKYNQHDLSAELEKEYSRWKIFLFGLFEISSFTRTGTEPVKSPRRPDEPGLKMLAGIRDVLFKETLKSASRNDFHNVSDKNTLKKLIRYFPYEPSIYSLMVEDIINSDYNRLSIWIKVIALRNLQEAKEDDLAQSVIALLFSPEQILREEAWMLIERSGDSPVNILGKRIYNIAEKKRDRIFSLMPFQNRKVYEKTRFLSSCFPMIPEEDLITLAENIIELNEPVDKIKIPGNGYVLWSFKLDKPEPEVNIATTGFFIGNEAVSPDKKTVFCYVLPLQAVEEYYVKHPERSFPIAEYIDNHEE